MGSLWLPSFGAQYQADLLRCSGQLGDGYQCQWGRQPTRTADFASEAEPGVGNFASVAPTIYFCKMTGSNIDTLALEVLPGKRQPEQSNAAIHSAPA
jgi:hypothetical protein